MEKWYYKIDAEEKGPVTAEQLQGMLYRGEIEQKTLVKGPNVAEWTHIDELEIGEPLLDVRGEGEVALEEDRTVDEIKKSRPWVRFVGRMFDYAWFALVLGWISTALNWDIETFGIMLIPLVWIFVETLFMGSWGTTPGKWMTQTYIRHKNGQKLSFKDAIYRSLSVWWLGMGAGIPIISLITMIVACVKLSNTGYTTWDRSGDFAIHHKIIGPIRIVGLIVFFIAFFWSIAPLLFDVN